MEFYGNNSAPMFLDSIGITYHGYGTITHEPTKTKIFDYYDCDKLTDKQIEILKQSVKNMRIVTSAPSYAPELKSYKLCFPKVGFQRVVDSGYSIFNSYCSEV